MFIGEISEQYLRKFDSVSGADQTFGLRDKDGKFYIGNKKVKIKENNIIVGDREYASTPGLWELIVATTPDDTIFTSGDALKRNNDESETKPKANKNWKWKHILKLIWDEKDMYTRNGIPPSVPTIILPCDPIALVERLDILLASKAA